MRRKCKGHSMYHRPKTVEVILLGDSAANIAVKYGMDKKHIRAFIQEFIHCWVEKVENKINERAKDEC